MLNYAPTTYKQHIKALVYFKILKAYQLAQISKYLLTALIIITTSLTAFTAIAQKAPKQRNTSTSGRGNKSRSNVAFEPSFFVSAGGAYAYQDKVMTGFYDLHGGINFNQHIKASLLYTTNLNALSPAVNRFNVVYPGALNYAVQYIGAEVDLTFYDHNRFQAFVPLVVGYGTVGYNAKNSPYSLGDANRNLGSSTVIPLEAGIGLAYNITEECSVAASARYRYYQGYNYDFQKPSTISGPVFNLSISYDLFTLYGFGRFIGLKD